MIEIRAVLPGDAARLDALRRRALTISPVELTGLSTAAAGSGEPPAALEDERTSFVAVQDGRWLGMVEATPERVPADLAGVVRLSSLWVEPSRRRHGLGRALVQAVLDRAAAAGAGSVVLEVQRSNTGAIALYRASGFAGVPDAGETGLWLTMVAALPATPTA